MSVLQFCAERGIPSRKLFEEAYKQERGFIFGLVGWEAIHDLWSKGWCDVPPYVKAYMRHQVERKDQPGEQLELLFV